MVFRFQKFDPPQVNPKLNSRCKNDYWTGNVTVTMEQLNHLKIFQQNYGQYSRLNQCPEKTFRWNWKIERRRCLHQNMLNSVSIILDVF